MYNYHDDANLSKSWKDLFELFDKCGFNGGKDPFAYKALPFWTRSRAQFNFLAFIFGPFYFLFKGMFRIAFSIFLFVIGLIGLLILFDLILGTNPSGFWTSSASGVIYALSANYAYYNYRVNGYRGWNPFLGMSRAH